MSSTPRPFSVPSVTSFMRAIGMILLFLGSATAALAQAASPTAAPVLFQVVGPRDTVTIGLTAAEFEAMGPEPGVARVARKLVAEGQLTAWRYVVGRASDGTTRLVATDRIAILRNDTLRIEPYHAALPIAGPPTSN